MKYLKAFFAVFAIILLAEIVVYFWFPSYLNQLLREDSLIENLSASFYFLSFLVGLSFLLKNKAYRVEFALIASIGLLGFLDEVSFGERLFELNMPHMLGVKIDASHDLFSLFLKIVRRIITDYPASSALLLLLFSLLTVKLFPKFKTLIDKLIKRNYGKISFVFAMIFTSLIFFALVIDMALIQHDFLFMLEEFFEMSAALVLIFCSMSLGEQRRLKSNVIHINYGKK